jgi:CrcB protein
MNAIALAIGAFIGTILRYEMGKWIEPLPNGFPEGTLIINWIGCLFLGWFFTIILFRFTVPLSVRIGVGTGFTGAFTTFSTFSVETVNLIKKHQYSLALTYVLLSVLCGVLLTAAGYYIAKFQSNKVNRERSAP